VAFAIDNLNIREVLGTIAGDDTILLIPRDGVSRSRLFKALQERIPGLEEEMA
jgi:transcriptional regulator of arginine metabolism